MAVGAKHWQTDALESYSLQGTTLDGRIKPDVTAPTAVSTTASGSGVFDGTSALLRMWQAPRPLSWKNIRVPLSTRCRICLNLLSIHGMQSQTRTEQAGLMSLRLQPRTLLRQTAAILNAYPRASPHSPVYTTEQYSHIDQCQHRTNCNLRGLCIYQRKSCAWTESLPDI